MDSVRFGRALGFGARHAARALVNAVDAAGSPNPTPKPAQPGRPAAASASRPAATPSAASTRVQQAREAHQGIQRGSKRFGQAVWNPFVRLSGVLWLEVTGVFFGIFALFAGLGAWKSRAEWHSPAGHPHIILAAAMAVLFGYFCVSSFVKAYRRERRR